MRRSAGCRVLPFCNESAGATLWGRVVHTTLIVNTQKKRDPLRGVACLGLALGVEVGTGDITVYCMFGNARVAGLE